MSTKEFQSHEDALTNYNNAVDRLKQARAEFVKHIRKTGIRIRKELIVPSNNFIAINCTLSDSRSTDVQMTVSMQSSGPLTPSDVTAARHWLLANNWKIQPGLGGEIDHRFPDRVCFFCI